MVRGFRFPVGPDAPVYLWWMRLAAHDGLSAVRGRPGIPALALELSGTLRLSPAATLAALECVLATCIGLGAAALVRARSGAGRGAWILAGALAGTFAVHLAAGYLANLAFGALFLAAAAALALGTSGAAIGAAALLGAAGLADPLFFVLGLVILGLAAAQAFWDERGSERPPASEARRIVAVAAGAGALLGAGLLALQAGPGPLAVDTSKDAFLRRAGLTAELRSAYFDRFLRHWTRYVQWASIPLAAAGLGPAKGFAGRFLRAWGAVLVVGVIAALVTGLAPADRFEAFGYVIPILAALGLVRLWRAIAHRQRGLAALVSGALLVAMLLGAAITWRRQAPYMSALEVARATDAGRFAAATAPHTPLVFLAESGNDTISFWATRAGNVIRAALPPDRIRDVLVSIAPLRASSPPGQTERAAWRRLFAADLHAAKHRSGRRPLTFVLAPFARPDFPTPHPSGLVRTTVVARGVAILDRRSPRPVASPVDPLRPSSAGAIVVAALVTFALLTAVGYGWSRAAAGGGFAALALAPAFGAAGLILGGIALERLGVSLAAAAGPTAISALVGGGGYLSMLLLQRRAGPEPPSKV